MSRRDHARLLLLAMLVLGCGWPSVAASLLQQSSVPLPAVSALTPLVAIAALILYRVPRDAPQVTDSETDVIVSVPLIALGVWLMIWSPGRLGDHYWLLRPDLYGLALCVIALSFLVAGTRWAGSAAPVVAMVAVVSTPGLQLLVAGVAPSAARAAFVSALMAAAPFLGARPLAGGALAMRMAGLVVAAAASAAIVGVLGVGTAHGGYLGACLGIAGTMVVAHGFRRRAGRSLSVSTVPGHRLVWATAAAAMLAGLNGYAMPALGADPSPSLAVVPPNGAHGFRLGSGIVVAAWAVHIPGPDGQRVLVVTTTGPTAAAVATYPTDTLVRWPVDTCPEVGHVQVGDRRAEIVRYADVERGFRWGRMEWTWPGETGAQRVSVIVAQGPRGTLAPLPVVGPAVGGDLARIIGRFIANRHLSCYQDRLQGGDPLMEAAEQVIAMSPTRGR